MSENTINNVLIALRRVIRATDMHSRSLIKETGLTTPQLLLLQSISKHGEVSIGKLAGDISLSQATVTSILDRLENRGMVYRKKSRNDKRKVHAYLTPKGEAAVKTAPLPLQDNFIRRFSTLPEWEQNMILSSLQHVATMMDAEKIDASPVLEIGPLDQQGR